MKFPCRLCLAQNSKDDLINIFNYNSKHSEDSLIDILFWVFAVEVDVTDPHTKEICKKCIILIEYVIEIRRTFQKSQDSLKKSNEKHKDFENNKEISNNEKEESFPVSSPTTTSNRKKKSHKNMSPSVKISLESLNTICPAYVKLQRFENTPESMFYKKLHNGTFRKRKYRHFQMDDKILDSICNTLDNNIKPDILKRDVGVGTKVSVKSRGINTDEVGLFDHTFPDEDSGPPPLFMYPRISNPGPSSPKRSPGNDDMNEIANNIRSALFKTVDDEVYDWTRLTFKKDVSTNTEAQFPFKKDVSTNTETRFPFKKDVSTNTEAQFPVKKDVSSNTETQFPFKKDVSTNTETRFPFKKDVSTNTETSPSINNNKEKRVRIKKSQIRVNIDSINHLSPSVWLEPLEDLIKKQNYKQVDSTCYVKDSEMLVSDEFAGDEQCKTNEPSDDEGNCLDYESQRKHMVDVKKKLYLDYFKNFRPFAVRELITGKNLRDENETNSIFKVANVCSVFVCNFCSKSFLTQASLNLHYSRTHKSVQSSKDSNNELQPQVPVRVSFNNRRRWHRRKIFASQKKNLNGDAKSNSNNISHTDQMETSQNSRLSELKVPIVNNAADKKSENSERIKRKVNIINYNIDSIINARTRFCFQPPKKHRRKRGRPHRLMTENQEPQIEKKCVNSAPQENRSNTDASYVWDRKGLGAYSAITLCHKNLTEEINQCDVFKKTDSALNATIKKLAGRLDSSDDKNEENSDLEVTVD